MRFLVTGLLAAMLMIPGCKDDAPQGADPAGDRPGGGPGEGPGGDGP